MQNNWLGGFITIALLGTLLGACGNQVEGQVNQGAEQEILIRVNRLGEQCVYTYLSGQEPAVELQLSNPNQNENEPGDGTERITIGKGERMIGPSGVSTEGRTKFKLYVGEINGSGVYCEWPGVMNLEGREYACASIVGSELRCR